MLVIVWFLVVVVLVSTVCGFLCGDVRFEEQVVVPLPYGEFGEWFGVVDGCDVHACPLSKTDIINEIYIIG